MGWLVSILVLSGLIFFHELGHYIAARLMGVSVQIFSIGFGKTLFSFNWINTQWKISMIPLGGYVQMKGQNDMDPTNLNQDDDSYNVKKPWQRIFILLAGPFANFIIAFLLFLAIGLGGPKVLLPILGQVIKDSPAFIAGLQTNDKITIINGSNIDTWKDMSNHISESKENINITVERGQYIKTFSITPKMRESKNEFNETIQKRMIGISPAGETRSLAIGNSFSYAIDKTIWASGIIFGGLKRLITGDVPIDQLGGVISIVKVTSDASERGWMAVLFFAALISVNLGILNLLPIPALDGGHIMFNLYEMIFRRPPNETALLQFTLIGWTALIGLMFLGIFNDINRLIN